MAARSKRQVFGIAVLATRLVGFLLIALAILGLPQMQPIVGNFSMSFRLLTSLALGLTGLVWLFGIHVFVHFFDRYLSRN